ncbi:M20/M25/M40 family metallo-hydrolase [Arachidicoccus soli]|uniref:M20/M25/M40 family metallo-hydrolase n=1 Tax=Arachidicoccus soli TaxID=2341117 RepID=A0A386HNN1_9BACT|nr:M20/M25/M40 family metallo-hydrolase [Arachidicoccus soli]AYD47527.1 M20/M25/M40 family metallo-hydrolase [Arachidicoccus soli]
MKKVLVFSMLSFTAFSGFSQSIDKIINAKEVAAIENVLASDSLRGRATFTDDIEKASNFIENKFQKIGLQPFPGAKNFRQEFFMNQSTNTVANITIDGAVIPDSLVGIISFQPKVDLTEKDNVKIIKLSAGDNIRQKIGAILKSKENLLVLVDPSFERYRSILRHLGKESMTPETNTIVFLFGVDNVKTFNIHLENTIVKKPLNNVVGILPGKTLPDEYVIFSAHYDHLGVGQPVNGDSIYNGANDDASGVTAVLSLAKYFKKANNNARTIIFATFTAEEIGEFGSQYFSKQFDPAKVVAMFNIEMIGTESKWGKNSAYITGYDKTDMGKILERNLTGSAFKFYPDPYTEQHLFYRSDNASLAKLGVPAHTISTSKMDNEPNYHKVSDEISTLDMDNMAEIIKAIALSSTTIVDGKDTPTRVDTSKLN